VTPEIISRHESHHLERQRFTNEASEMSTYYNSVHKMRAKLRPG